MTLEQVKADIAAGLSTRIYYSQGTLWWTHLDKDVEEATTAGDVARKARNKLLLEDPNFPLEKKKKLRSLMALIDGSEHQIPTDPAGSPLFQMDEPMKWVTDAEERPEHFGRHGLDAFMMTHHQNTGLGLMSWEAYNVLVDTNGPPK